MSETLFDTKRSVPGAGSSALNFAGSPPPAARVSRNQERAAAREVPRTRSLSREADRKRRRCARAGERGAARSVVRATSAMVLAVVADEDAGTDLSSAVPFLMLFSIWASIIVDRFLAIWDSTPKLFPSGEKFL